MSSDINLCFFPLLVRESSDINSVSHCGCVCLLILTSVFPIVVVFLTTQIMRSFVAGVIVGTCFFAIVLFGSRHMIPKIYSVPKCEFIDEAVTLPPTSAPVQDGIKFNATRCSCLIEEQVFGSKLAR